MPEFVCRFGTPSGEIVTRIVEAHAAGEARAELEREGYRVFDVSSTEGGIGSLLSIGGSGGEKKGEKVDFFVFN